MKRLYFTILFPIFLVGCYHSGSHRLDGWDMEEDIVEPEHDVVRNEPDIRPDGPDCGNGILEPGEQCDDGNTHGGDGCSALCQLESQPDEDAYEADFVDVVPDEAVEIVTDELDAGETPLELVWVSIPAGTFDMGCSPGDTECLSSESPRHSVNVSAFWITETEITQAQYEWVTGDTPSSFTSCGASCPVELVDWHDAKAFCEAIGVRLPSEAEWEYAARAGTTTRYYCGDDVSCLDEVAWYYANCGYETHPGGEKTANAFGLFDMLGNVWEWVEDCWHDDYTGAPSIGEVWGGGNCSYHVCRGGSWHSDPVYMRMSVRPGLNPDYRDWNMGFRCAQ